MSFTATKKAASALRSNKEAIERAFENVQSVVFGRVEGCLGNAQFRLKFADGSEGRGAPLGKFTFATLRIAPGQIVVCEPGKAGTVLTIIGRFDRQKDIAELIKRKIIPRSLAVDESSAVCFEDGFEFDESDKENDEKNAKEEKDASKVLKRLNVISQKKLKTPTPQELLKEDDEAAAIAENEFCEGEEKFQKRRKKKITPTLASVETSLKLYENTEKQEDAVFKLPVYENWETAADDEIDIDAI